MARKAGKMIGKICLTLICLFISGIITSICKNKGIILGGIPTMILYMPIIGALFRIWRKPAEKETPEQASVAPETQPQGITEEKQTVGEVCPSRDAPVSRKSTVIISALSIICAICVVMLMVSSQEIETLTKDLAEQREELKSLNAELTKKEDEIKRLTNAHGIQLDEYESTRPEAFNDAWELTEEQKEIANKVIEKHQSENTNENLSALYACVERVRQGDGGIFENTYDAWKEYKPIFDTIENMFRGVERDAILEYFAAVYYLETELYPIEYFKNKGYTYTGDLIPGWEP